MPSPESLYGDVSVILHKESALYIPPEGLLREARRDEKEKYESTAYRIGNKHNMLVHIDYALPTLGIEGAPTMTYLAQPRRSKLDKSEFFISQAKIEDALRSHPLITETDRKLFELAMSIIHR